MYIRIWYHFIANLHIALLQNKRTRKRKWEAHLSKPRRFDEFPSQNSACICVILEEQFCDWYHGASVTSIVKISLYFYTFACCFIMRSKKSGCCHQRCGLPNVWYLPSSLARTHKVHVTIYQLNRQLSWMKNAQYRYYSGYSFSGFTFAASLSCVCLNVLFASKIVN